MLNCAILTISDTRTAKTDESGAMLEGRVLNAGHTCTGRFFSRDDVKELTEHLGALIEDPQVNVILATGGTGITRRDITPEVISKLSTKEIPGFGELFRMLSFRQIGTSTIQSRASAWLCETTLVFALPGSPRAVQLAWDEILESQLNHEHKPCNFVQLLPRL